MSTNGTLSVLGVCQYFTQFSLKQKLVFDMINLVQDAGSGAVKLAEVVLIPGFISVLPFFVRKCVLGGAVTVPLTWLTLIISSSR